jgi:hypothetical protein
MALTRSSLGIRAQLAPRGQLSQTRPYALLEHLIR